MPLYVLLFCCIRRHDHCKCYSDPDPILSKAHKAHDKFECRMQELLGCVSIHHIGPMS